MFRRSRLLAARRYSPEPSPRYCQWPTAHASNRREKRMQ